jgi:hypothetical protein
LIIPKGNSSLRAGLPFQVLVTTIENWYYINEGVVTSKSINDATHVAAATIARADAIISWNFKHIVRLDKMKGYNQINLLNGYGILTIISPLEVTIDEANDN